MAVWGTPTAREDDAERAVRAALDLVAAVPGLAAPGGDRPQARAAVLTGEAAAVVGAQGQGMVAGDLVNTASRLQAAAPPGTVLVGEATQRAAGEAIVFEAAGEQLLRGKTAPVPAWRAVRVVAGRRGAGRSSRVEPPFVGRDEELQLLKDLLHATDPRRARPPRLGRGDRRDREEPPRLGAGEVRRRRGGRHLLASRPLPGVRGGPRLLGARRDGPRAGRHRRERRRGDVAGEAARRRSASTSPTRRSGPGWSRAWRPSSGWRRRPPASARSSRPPAGPSSSGSRSAAPSSSSSRSSSGPTRRSSTSSRRSPTARARGRSSS